jgi:hypothetical protein
MQNIPCGSGANYRHSYMYQKDNCLCFPFNNEGQHGFVEIKYCLETKCLKLSAILGRTNIRTNI